MSDRREPAERCAIYARFSSDRQSETSADDQVRDCRRFAESQGWSVVDVWTDLAISGANIRRPGMTGLLSAVAEGRYDVVLAEDLDRIARDLEDVAGIHKRVRFAGARIHTIAAGEITALHVGLKGTMDALELEKIAEKVRRGQRGNITRGKSAGGLCYGYEVVRQLDDKGELVRGLRRIVPEQAAIVVRILREYAAGRSPIAICRGLNAEGVPGPAGGEWAVSTIVGNRARRIGILHNPIYVGQLVYNRVRMVRDPETRRRVSRPNPDSALEIVEVPELRIADDALWQRVQRVRRSQAAVPLRDRRRPRHLLSGLVACASCEGGYAVHTGDRLRCARRARGGTCGNARTIRLAELQRRVLAGLKEKLLSAEAVSLVVREYHEERSKQRTAGAAVRRRATKRLAELEAAIARLVAAIAEGGEAFAEVRAALSERTEERDRLRAEIAAEEAHEGATSVIALHPHVADKYRERIEALIEGLQREEITADSSAGQIRALIGTVRIFPGDAIEVVTSLEAAVALATAQPKRRGVGGTVLLVAEDRDRQNSTGHSISV